MALDARRLDDATQGITYESALAELERETVRGVNEKMRGQQVDAILAALVSQFEGRFPGVDFDPGQLRLTASAISRGTLRI